ncbi:MAG: toxin ParE1/3/4 [Saprospiraceae bacterium]|jgi:toxin ParE1/3/4|tara:strand:- start:1030 stop:1317 length:288 start_codon:yes stop_codon:yes gene_type:complete
MLYELSFEAVDDLENIFENTYYQLGYDQATKYLDSFDAFFYDLCLHPYIGILRDELLAELRSINHQSHLIFYRLKDNKIIIIRILHGSRDLPRYF